ncbi:hypothetical protein VitviT2T_021269 [Vitis vinifera]|uniref:Uncharacterized protein n=1 Tax=Vitis vinifera TaxID=29760 RepID=A0ABY9D6H1_VITVI|nr:hypothetical protein VitviT2T_021269 [Vitis vinifera]
MPDIERYMVVGCLCTYLQFYKASRRELEGLRQRSDEFISPFISHRQGKIAEIVDRPLQRDDLVLRVIGGLIRDPMGKFRPNWSGPYFIRELTPEGTAWLMDLDGNRFSEPINVDQLKRRFHATRSSTYHTFDAILGHISVSIEIYGSSWSCMLIPTYEIHIDTMFPPWSLLGVTQLGLHFAMLRCHHAFLPRDAPLIYGSDSVIHLLCERYLGLIREHSDCDGPGVMFRFPWLADNLMSEHSSSDGSERARNVNWFPVAVAAAEDADDGGVLSSPNSTVSFFSDSS